MRSRADFYGENRWTRRFLAANSAYTIIRGKHAGVDIGYFGGVAEEIPALVGGTVVVSTKTAAMGYVVIIDTGMAGAYRYHSYCHLSGDRVAGRGERIAAGGRVGRLARGPRGVSWSSVDYPGSWDAWDGIHLHFVMCAVMTGSYIVGAARPDQFGNPETLIRSILSAAAGGGGSRPFDPSEDDMPLDPNADYPAFAQMLQRALKFDVRPNGVGASGALGPTIFEQLDRAAVAPPSPADIAAAVNSAPVQAQDADGRGVSRDGKPVTFASSGYAASTNAQVAAIREMLKTIALGQGVDPELIEEAAERGARAAFDGLTLVAKPASES